MDKALTLPELLETVPNDARLVLSNEDERGVDIIPVGRLAREAAAELRRLHAENERLHQINCSHEMKLSVRGYEIQIADLEAQRDALLEVLKYLDKAFRQHGRQHWPEAVRVRLAIKSVEEGK